MKKFVVCTLLIFGLLMWPAHAARAKSTTPAPKAKAATKAAKPTAPVKSAPKAAPAAKKNAETESEPMSADVSWICIEPNSGLVLSEHNADIARPPASMIKMMMFLMVSEGVKQGKWTLETPITVTAHAEHIGGTQVEVKAGEVWPLGHMMLAIAVASANDAAMAVAEGLWGSEENFKAARAARAKELGMLHSDFQSVHGLPPGKGQKPDSTTARDMSIIARQCATDPQIMEWAGTKEMRFKPDQSPRFNTNKLLWRMEGCDGIKTGFTNAAGFCVTATAQRDGVRLITVLMGCEGKYDRFNDAQKILEDGFPLVKRVRVMARGEALKTPSPVFNCRTRETLLTAADDLWVVVKADETQKLQVVPEITQPLRAPLASGAVVGTVSADLGGKRLASIPLAVNQDLPAATWRWKLENAVRSR